MSVMTLEQQYHVLRETYARRLPEKLTGLEKGIATLEERPGDAEVLDRLYTTTHGLIGSAASFDFPELSEQARPMAALLKRFLEGSSQPSPETFHWMAMHMGQMRHAIHDIHESISIFTPPQLEAPDERPVERQVFFFSRDDELRQRLAWELEKRDALLRPFDTMAALRQALSAGVPGGILLDQRDLENDRQPLVFSNRFNQRQTPVPVIVLADHDDIHHRLWAAHLASTHFFRRSVDMFRLVRILAPWTKEKPKEPFRVLVLDDDEILTRLYQAVLEGAGMTVSVLNDPFQVLERIQAFKPELLILDLYMPGCNGIELASVIRQSEQLAGLPILFLSAEQNLGRRLSDRNLAHEDYLIKPVRPTALTRAVVTRIQRSRAQGRVADHLRSALQELENIQFALNQHAIISTTDVKGRITFVNDKFCEISGYTPQELIGQNHRIIKSNYHPKSYFRQMWQTITRGKVWHGQVKNRRRDGSFYWVEATIVPFLNEEGQPYEYVSIRTDISQQKQAEEQARSMALFAEMNPAPVLRVDPSGCILESNPAADRILAVAEGYTDSILPYIPAISESRLAHCIGHGEIISTTSEVGRRHFQFTIQGVPELGVGHVYGNDVTQLKLAKEELQQAKEYAENLIESSLDMIVAVDLERRIVGFNRAAERAFGYSRQEVIGQPVDVLYANRDARELPRNRANVTGEFKGEIRNRRKNGEVFYSFLSSSALQDKQGRVIGYMGISRDITDWKTAEETVRESEERLRTILESTVDGIIVADENGEVELFNPAAERIFGYTFEEVRGRSISLLMPAPYASRHDRYMRDYLETGKTNIIGVGREFEALRKDGSRVPVWLSVSAFTLGDKRMFTGVVSDMTARKQAEMELRLAKEAAEKASRAKSEFLSSMSHELRTPMNAVLGFAQLLESDPLEPLSEAQQDSVQEIMNAGNHLLELINEVLDLAKIEAGKIRLNMEEVALRDVVEDCLTLISSAAAKREVKVIPPHAACRCDSFLVEGDRTRLKQVLLNLLSNAVKYNRERGTVRICCNPVEGGRMVRLSVSDTGVGIPSEELAQVFEPFNRLGAEEGEVEGTGIGLVITKRIVELMGGRIGLTSTVGEGSTFWVELVVAEFLDLAPEPEAQEGERSAHEAGRDAQAVTLLYVEDTPANLKLVERILSRRPGVRLITAPEAALGLELAISQRPDVILLDINLPGMDGFQLLERLHGSPLTRHIPVLAVSANAMPEDVQRGRAAGFLDYLTKPIRVEEFMAALDRAMAGLKGRPAGMAGEGA